MPPFVRIAAVVAVMLVLHTSAFASMHVAGVQADLMLLLTALAGLVGGTERGAVVGFVAGLSVDLVLATPLGLSALTFSLIGFAVGTVQGSILRATFWIAPATASAAGAAGVLLYGLAGFVVGQSSFLSPRLPLIAAVVAIFNGVLAPLALPLVRWAAAVETTRRRP